MGVILTCKTKIEIDIQKGILSEIQIWNMARKNNKEKKAREQSKISVYHCTKSDFDRFGMK